MRQVRTHQGNYTFPLSTNATEAYDPTTDSWTAKAPMPIPRADFATAVYENKIYVFGGEIFSSGSPPVSAQTSETPGYYVDTNATEVYDPATNTWTEKTPLPIPSQGLSANTIDGKIYIITDGYQLDPVYHTYWTVKKIEVYDPLTDSWAVAAPMPTGVSGYASAVVDNKIYVISGRNGSDPNFLVNLTQTYDPETNVWSPGAPIPFVVERAGAGTTTGAVAPQAIYVIGGSVDVASGGGFSVFPRNLTQVYFPENDSWSLGASMPTAEDALGVAVVNDTIYAIVGGGSLRFAEYVTGGGGSFSFPSAKNEQYLPLGYGNIKPNTGSNAPWVYVVAAVVAVAVAESFIALLVLKKRRSKNFVLS